MTPEAAQSVAEAAARTARGCLNAQQAIVDSYRSALAGGVRITRASFGAGGVPSHDAVLSGPDGRSLAILTCNQDGLTATGRDAREALTMDAQNKIDAAEAMVAKQQAILDSVADGSYAQQVLREAQDPEPWVLTRA